MHQWKAKEPKDNTLICRNEPQRNKWKQNVQTRTRAAGFCGFHSLGGWLNVCVWGGGEVVGVKKVHPSPPFYVSDPTMLTQVS